mmetsp:Transcript_13993/g.52271  ORF Transcript_13993/g.52271 Transcript_13993/m.52271 type:complete len:261 (+) Transcript_13993:406-1188(+)
MPKSAKTKNAKPIGSPSSMRKSPTGSGTTSSRAKRQRKARVTHFSAQLRSRSSRPRSCAAVTSISLRRRSSLRPAGIRSSAAPEVSLMGGGAAESVFPVGDGLLWRKAGVKCVTAPGSASGVPGSLKSFRSAAAFATCDLCSARIRFRSVSSRSSMLKLFVRDRPRVIRTLAAASSGASSTVSLPGSVIRFSLGSAKMLTMWRTLSSLWIAGFVLDFLRIAFRNSCMRCFTLSRRSASPREAKRTRPAGASSGFASAGST